MPMGVAKQRNVDWVRSRRNGHQWDRVRAQIDERSKEAWGCLGVGDRVLHAMVAGLRVLVFRAQGCPYDLQQ